MCATGCKYRVEGASRSDVQQQNRDSTFKLAKTCASDYTVPYFPKSKYEAAIYNGVGL